PNSTQRSRGISSASAASDARAIRSRRQRADGGGSHKGFRGRGRAARGSMLKARVLTAAVLLAGFGAALFLLPQAGWVGFCALLAGAAAWEWGALAALQPRSRALYAFALLLLFLSPLLLAGSRGAGELYAPAWVYFASGFFWVVLAPLWIWRSDNIRSRPLLLAVGALTLAPACAALVDLRGGHPALLLAVLATVWISDSAAYFTGRRSTPPSPRSRPSPA